MNKFPKKIHRGFTLMEVMVSVSIFAIIVTVGIVALLAINNAYRKSETERQAVDSMTFMLESMSRRIRTATTWNVSNYNASSGAFSFVDQDGITVNYHWDSVDGELLADINDPNTSDPVPTANNYNLTPELVHISNVLPDGTPLPGGGVTFTPMESAGGQPYLQINIGGYVVDGQQISPFVFQTGVSKRVAGP